MSTKATVLNDNGTIIADCPPNSNKSKIIENGVEEEKKKKIIKGEVVTKRSVTKDISNSFLDACNYIFSDVLVPALKNTISDMVRNGIDIMLFGNTRNDRRGSNNSPYISYSNAYNDRRGDNRPIYSARTHDIDDIILNSRGDAEDVVDTLNEYIDRFGMASVADLYDLIGKASAYTDNDYGWRDLSRASVRQVREGYLLQLPRPMSLK